MWVSDFSCEIKLPVNQNSLSASMLWLIFSEWSLNLRDAKLCHPERGDDGSSTPIASRMFHQSGSCVFWGVLPGNYSGRELKLRCMETSEYMAAALKCLARERVRWDHRGDSQCCPWKNFLKNTSCSRTDWAALWGRSSWPWKILRENCLILCWKWFKTNLGWIGFE